MSRARTLPTTERFPNRWALFPICLLGILVSVQAVLFSLSRNDPTFAVEPEYYQKAVSWNEHAAQRAVNQRLGWQASAAVVTEADKPTLRVDLKDDQGRPVTGAALGITAFPNARAADIQTLSPRETQPGVYEAPVRLALFGEWEIRLTAHRDTDTFTHTSRTIVTAKR